MAKPLSNDIRSRLVAAVEGGMSCRAAAERYDVAPSVAIKLMQQWRETGSFEPKPQGGDQRSGRIENLARAILSMVDERPDITLAEIAARLESDHGEHFAISTVHGFFGRRGITFKKNGARGRAVAA